MQQFVLHRNFTLATTKGHRISFEKGKPTAVPDICVPDAVAIGAVPADGAPVDVIQEQVKAATQDDPMVRAADVLAAIKMICERNRRADFSASGAPKEAAVTQLTGYEVSKRERDDAWQAYHNARAEERAAA